MTMAECSRPRPVSYGSSFALNRGAWTTLPPRPLDEKAFAATEALAHEQCRDLYLEMRQRHLSQLQLEKDKAEYSFRARRKLLQSIGLPEVRDFALRQLAQEEARNARTN